MPRRAFVKFALACSLVAAATTASVSIMLTPVLPQGWVPAACRAAGTQDSPERWDARRELLRVQYALEQHRPFLALPPSALHGIVIRWSEDKDPLPNY